MPDHPFKDTPQYELVYTNKRGKPLARPQNGIGKLPRRSPASSVPTDLRWCDTGKVVYESDLECLQEATESPERAWDDLGGGITAPVLYEAMQKLTARQRFVLELSFGIRDGVAYTTYEIADYMGVSQQMVSKHYLAAIQALKGWLSASEVDAG